MNNHKLSPQNITFLLVGLSLLPRIFSESAFQTGTIIILIFWISPFVILPELISDYCKIVNLSKLPRFTKIFLVVISSVVIITFIFRKSIYQVEFNKLTSIKRALYLINPLIYLCWLPLVNKKTIKQYKKLIILLIISLTLSLTIPKIIIASNVGDYLNSFTAKNAKYLLSFFGHDNIQFANQYFYSKEFSIKVGSGCSSVPQIVISVFSILSMYLCCKINSKKNMLIVILITILTAFLTNLFRVALMGHFVAINKMKLFEFWHDGAGSMIFSFVIMLISASIYYFYWTKENPLN